MSRYLAVLLLLGAIWGTSFLFIKVAVTELPPETVVTGRLVFATLILLAVVYGRGLRLPTRLRTWGDFLVMGAFGVVAPFVLITWGEQSIPSGMAAILNATMPLFSALIAFVWTREERMSGLRLLGVVLGFVGVVTAIGLKDVNLANASTQGQIAVLVAAFCYAITGLYARRAFRGMPALIPATGQLVAGSLVIAPIALVRHGIPSMPSWQAIGAILALALFCTSVAYILLYWLMERIGATRTSMVTYLSPPFALVYGALLLHEQITPGAIMGLLLVFGGILLANGIIRWPSKPVQLATTKVGK